MKKFYEILKKCPLFDQIESDDLSRMLDCFGARIAVFDKKYTIFAEGTPAKYIGIVLSGSVQLSQLDFFGNRSIISVVEPSQLFGESFACAESDSVPATVTANEVCEVMLIDCTHILHTCSNNCSFHRQLIFNLMKCLAEKNILFYQKAGITSKRSTREKLMAYLLIEAKKADSPSFSIPFDRQELADYLEVDRSGLSAEISKLRNEGVLLSKKNHFELLQF